MVCGTPSRWNNRDKVLWASPFLVMGCALSNPKNVEYALAHLFPLQEGVPANSVLVKVMCGNAYRDASGHWSGIVVQAFTRPNG
jgi:hypothetical protein